MDREKMQSELIINYKNDQLRKVTNYIRKIKSMVTAKLQEEYDLLILRKTPNELNKKQKGRPIKEKSQDKEGIKNEDIKRYDK